jgi:hypothetical protein
MRPTVTMKDNRIRETDPLFRPLAEERYYPVEVMSGTSRALGVALLRRVSEATETDALDAEAEVARPDFTPNNDLDSSMQMAQHAPLGSAVRDVARYITSSGYSASSVGWSIDMTREQAEVAVTNLEALLVDREKRLPEVTTRVKKIREDGTEAWGVYVRDRYVGTEPVMQAVKSFATEPEARAEYAQAVGKVQRLVNLGKEILAEGDFDPAGWSHRLSQLALDEVMGVFQVASSGAKDRATKERLSERNQQVTMIPSFKQTMTRLHDWRMAQVQAEQADAHQHGPGCDEHH